MTPSLPLKYVLLLRGHYVIVCIIPFESILSTHVKLESRLGVEESQLLFLLGTLFFCLPLKRVFFIVRSFLILEIKIN